MIRTMDPGDTDELVRLWLDASAQAHDFLPESFREHAEADMREVFLPMSDEVVLHAEDSTGRIDAFLAFTGDFLGALFVRPDVQGRGLGRRMLRIALRMHPDLTLSVYRLNARAVGFYLRNGLAVLDRRTEEASGCEELIMGRPPRG